MTETEDNCHDNLGFQAKELPICTLNAYSIVDLESCSEKISSRDATTSNGEGLDKDTASVKTNRVYTVKFGSSRSKYVCEQEENDVDEDVVMDECGWGWVVVLGATVCNGTVFGVLLSFGVLYNNMRDKLSEELNANISHVGLETALVGSVADCMTFLFAPVSSVLMERLGPRMVALAGSGVAATGMFSTSWVRRVDLLYVTYGLTLGLGSSLIMTPSLTITGQYFHKRLGLVNGMTTFGSAVFTAVMPFLLVYLLEQFAMKTFMILSSFYGLCFLAAFTYKPRLKQTDNLCNCGVGREIARKIFKKKNYVVWLVAIILSHFTMYVPIVHLVKHASLVAAGQGQPEVIQTIFGAVSGVSRLLIGPVSDLPAMRRHRIRIHQASFMLGGVTVTLIPLATKMWHLYLVSVSLGLAQSMMIAQFTPVVIDLVGLKSGSIGVGVAMGCLSLPLLSAPAFAGYMFDQIGDYFLAFHLAGIPGIVASLLLFIIRISWPDSIEGEVADVKPASGTPVMRKKGSIQQNSTAQRLYNRRNSVAHVGFF